jgi:hypothetical protein
MCICNGGMGMGRGSARVGSGALVASREEWAASIRRVGGTVSTRSVYTGALNYLKRKFYVGLLTRATSQRFVTVVSLVSDSRRLIKGDEVSMCILCSS